MFYLLTGGLAAYIAHRRGGSPLAAGFLGAFAPVLGILAALTTPPREDEEGVG